MGVPTCLWLAFHFGVPVIVWLAPLNGLYSNERGSQKVMAYSIRMRLAQIVGVAVVLGSHKLPVSKGERLAGSLLNG